MATCHVTILQKYYITLITSKNSSVDFEEKWYSSFFLSYIGNREQEAYC